MSLFMLYFLFAFLPNLNDVVNGWAVPFTLLLIFSVIGFALSKLGIMLSTIEDNEELKKVFGSCDAPCKGTIRIAIIGLLVIGLVQAVIPSREQLLYIAGGYAATNSKELKALPDNILKAANTYLGKITDDMAADKKE